MSTALSIIDLSTSLALSEPALERVIPLLAEIEALAFSDAADPAEAASLMRDLEDLVPGMCGQIAMLVQAVETLNDMAERFEARPATGGRPRPSLKIVGGLDAR